MKIYEKIGKNNIEKVRIDWRNGFFFKKKSESVRMSENKTY